MYHRNTMSYNWWHGMGGITPVNYAYVAKTNRWVASQTLSDELRTAGSSVKVLLAFRI